MNLSLMVFFQETIYLNKGWGIYNEYESIGTHEIALYINDKNITLFDSFGVENIPK